MAVSFPRGVTSLDWTGHELIGVRSVVSMSSPWLAVTAPGAGIAVAGNRAQILPRSPR